MKVKAARFSQHPPHPFALLRTCRQIYSDAALLPYKLNMFSMSTHTDIRLLANFLPVQTAAITRIIFEFGRSESYISLETFLEAIYFPQALAGNRSLKSLSFPSLPGLKEVIVVARDCVGYKHLHPRVVHWFRDLKYVPDSNEPVYVLQTCIYCL